MLVVPVVVLAGWAMDREMTLAFPVQEVPKLIRTTLNLHIQPLT
jgi:Ca2+/H+ antiporter